MYKKQLEKFFAENKITDKIPSAQAIAHFMMRMSATPETDIGLRNVIDTVMQEQSPERFAEADPGKAEIAAATTPADIIRLMRREVDTLNRPALIDKAMEMEAAIVPDVVRRLKTNLSDGFIETAAQFLARSTMDFAEEIIGYFDEMHNPYAQSILLVLLGFKADEKHIPWLIEQHDKLKKLHPDENYCQGAHYALAETEGRFYA